MTKQPTGKTDQIERRKTTARSYSGWPLWLALALVGVIWLLVRARYEPPAPEPATAPAAQFSAIRAEAMLVRILGNQEPHPVGSAADARVREGIVGELKGLGYQPEVRQAFACNTEGICAEVHNVVARLDGSEGGKAVLLAAHYDSVPAGPGASDDGANIAAELEIARALKAGRAPLHPVIFLFDEGEEAGLLGAVAFVEQNPWAREVGAAVNLEARGTSGPSLMFETGSHSLWLMPLFARAVQRPLANSLYYAVYRRLPNNTDFSVFKKHGFQGFNFAFIGGVTHYHTLLDNLSHLSRRSLQSQGQAALGVVRTLANAQLASQRPGEAVFFDLGAWKMIWWPEGWTPWLAGLAAVLLLVCEWRLMWGGKLGTGALGKGLVTLPLVILGAGVLAAGLHFGLHAAGSAPNGWVARPGPLVAAFLLLGFSVAVGVAAWVGERAGFHGFWCGTWLWWVLVALVLALEMPEASFPWLVPALAAGIFGMLAAFFDGPGWELAAGLVPALVATALTFEIAPLLYPAVGSPALLIIAVLFAALGTTLAPFIGEAPKRIRAELAIALAVMTVALAVVAALLPPYTANSRQRANFEFVQDVDTGHAEWLVTPASGKLPAGLAAVARFERRTYRPVPWLRLPAAAFAAPAKPLGIGGPVLQVLDERDSGGDMDVRAQLLSSRGAPVVGLFFPPGVRVTWFRMQGQLLPPLSARVRQAMNGWQRFACVTTPAGGVTVSFAVQGTKRVKVLALDESYGLPAEGRKLELARPADTVASQSGDVTVMTRRVTIGAER
jgi:hypothetical protein